MPQWAQPDGRRILTVVRVYLFLPATLLCVRHTACDAAAVPLRLSWNLPCRSAFRQPAGFLSPAVSAGAVAAAGRRSVAAAAAAAALLLRRLAGLLGPAMAVQQKRGSDTQLVP